MISVCMATFNGEKYLTRQLDTILQQLGKEDELIISDDSSTDRTVDIIRSYHDNRIKLLEKCQFRNPVFNMENAIKKAKGHYIFLADQDDVWLSGRVAKMVDKLQQYDLVVCNAFIVDAEENIVHESYFEWKGSGIGFWRNLKKNSFLGCCMAFNQKTLNIVLPFPRSIVMHDIWIGLLVEQFGKILFLQDQLILYRRHSNNFTAAISRDDEHLSDFSLAFKIKYRFYFLVQVIKRHITKNILKI